MDATREHLLGRILLERRALAEEDLRRLFAERATVQATLLDLLVRDRRIDAATSAALSSEVEARGRACFACRRAYLVPEGGSAACPSCGGSALLPGAVQQSVSPSGRFASSRPASREPGSRVGSEIKTLGPYELLAELGRGGVGVVYKARHRENGSVVALKVLLSGELAAPKTLARFQEESAAVQRLDHPNIVPVHEAGTIDGVHYFTMRFIEGDLFQALLKAKVPVLRGAEILRDVAHGAQHAHEHGIVHRDLKPANIIIERASGAPLIMDFGLAKDLESESGLSKTGVALGTPHYMPPEQALGRHREIDARADVYALGAMLYVVLAGKVPFNAESPGELLRRICEDEPVPPRTIRPDAPRDLETVALKALRKSKEDRYASALDFALDIERALAGKPVVADREAFWRPLVRRAARNPRASVVVLACALVAAGSVAWGVHAAVEAERRRAEEAALAEKAELERKKREAAEEVARARAEAAASIAKSRALREKARRAPSLGNARDLLGEAVAALEKAVARAPEGSDEHAEALAEHATTSLELGPRTAWGAALDELAQATGPVAARARLARGLHFLRREHDAERARKELEAASGIGGDKAERAAALLARAWLEAIDERTEDAVRDAREAATLSDELALLARRRRSTRELSPSRSRGTRRARWRRSRTTWSGTSPGATTPNSTAPGSTPSHGLRAA